MKRLLTLLLVSTIILCPMAAQEKATYIPEKLQTAIFFKLLPFNKLFKGKLSIHVIGNKKIATEFTKAIGMKHNGISISKVTQGSKLPSYKPDVIYIGDEPDKQKILNYCRENKILSICNSSATIKSGASLGLIASKGKTKILIGIQGTRLEKIKWNANIYKMATLIK